MKVTHLIAALALAVGGTMAVSPALANPPPWAPANGWRAHHYVYYPAARIYYEPATRLWFWLGDGGWRTGVSLPLALRGDVRVGGVRIVLDVGRPYLRDVYVVHRYGGYRHYGWDRHNYRVHREHWRHGNWNNGGHWRHHGHGDD